MLFPNPSVFSWKIQSTLKLFLALSLFIAFFIIVSSTDCGKLAIRPGDIRTYSPWTCAVFTRAGENQFKFFTTGTIIGPNAVLIVARGPFGSILKGSNDSKILPPADIFVVAAGVNSTDYNSFDEHRQLSRVNYLEPDVTADDSNEHFHFMILHLKTLLHFRSPYVKALCLFPEESINRISPTGWEFVSSGFAVNGLKGPSAVLSVATIQTFSKENCSSYYRFHYGKNYEETQIYCGKKSRSPVNLTSEITDFSTATGSFRSLSGHQSCFLHGSVNVFQVGERWSLGGIVVLIPERRRGKCDDNSVYIYAQADQQLTWMKSSLTCGPDKFTCGDAENTCIPITSVCNKWADCPGGRDELESLCIAQNHCGDEGSSEQTYSCGVTSNCIKKSQVCDNNIDCLDGIDEENDFCFQFRSRVPVMNCPTLKLPRGASASCSDNSTDEDCLRHNDPGTNIKFYCREFFESIYWYTSFETTCDGENGIWLNKLPFACSAACGIFPPLAKSWINNETFYRNFPWNGYVNSHKRFMNFKYEPLCSAVLIDSNFALVSGQCLKKWDLSPDILDVIWEPTMIKNYYDFFWEQNMFTQAVTAIQIWFASEIYGQDVDLALVKINPPDRLQPGQGIPACYLRTPPQLRNVSLDNVTGRLMHIASSDREVDVELWRRIEPVDYKIVSSKDCVERFGQQNVKGYTFCARPVKNRSVLHSWDVGTGFYILMQNPVYGDYQFYLKGLAINPKYPVKQNLTDGLQLFINPDKFIDWIIVVMENNY